MKVLHLSELCTTSVLRRKLTSNPVWSTPDPVSPVYRYWRHWTNPSQTCTLNCPDPGSSPRSALRQQLLSSPFFSFFLHQGKNLVSETGVTPLSPVSDDRNVLTVLGTSLLRSDSGSGRHVLSSLSILPTKIPSCLSFAPSLPSFLPPPLRRLQRANFRPSSYCGKLLCPVNYLQTPLRSTRVNFSK